MLALVAGPAINTGQLITHLLISFLPVIIIALLHAMMPSNPKSRRFLVVTFGRQMQWRLRRLGGPIHWPIRKKERKKFCKPVWTCWNAENVPMTRRVMRAYILPTAIASYQFGVGSSASCKPSITPKHQAVVSRGLPPSLPLETKGPSQSDSTQTLSLLALIVMHHTAW
jgi:hypothetical protein